MGEIFLKALINGKLILPDAAGNFRTVIGKALLFDEKIIDIADKVDDSPEIIDAKNFYVSPGFINIHIHGFMGADAMDENPESLDIMQKFLPSTGVTSFLATTMTMPKKNICTALENIGKKMTGKISGAKILGAHLEGPFVSKKFCGAQSKENIIPADFDFIDKFRDVVKIVTFAPEELPDFDFIDKCREKNIVPSIGHSAADYDTAISAIKRGAGHITHLFNAQTGLHHRNPGIVGAAFDSDVKVELITDNIHVHPATQRIVYKIKSKEKIILITDSMRACGLGDGVSELGGQKVFVKGNFATLENGNLAASVIKMNDAVKNFRENTGADMGEVVESVTKNPAESLKIFDKIGSIETGKSADFTIFDENFDVKYSFVDGQIFFRKS